MDRDLLIKGLLLAARNRDEISALLEGIDSDHGDRGVIKLRENFVNEGCRDLILSLAQGKLDDYHLSFRGGKIYTEIVAKVVIKAKARLVLNIEKLVFEPKKHEVALSYERDGMTLANSFIPKILEKIVEANPGKIGVEDNLILVDLDKFIEIPPWLAIKYMDADMGSIDFAFLIV